MYKIKDYVRYGEKGIFQIKEIQQKVLKGKELTECYVLYSDNNGLETTVITPVTNTVLRAVMTKEEAIYIINQFEKIKVEWNDDKRSRDEWSHSALASGNVLDMVAYMKSVYFARLEKNKTGKDVSNRDKDAYMTAEKLLFEELAISLGIKTEDVLGYIKNVIKGGV